MTSPPSLPAGHTLRAASFWVGFNLKRQLRRRSFWLWVAAVVGLLGLVTSLGALKGHRLGELFVLRVTPLLCLFFSTGVIREEIEDQTLTYPFSRPVGRAWLYGARVVAALVPVALLGLIPAFVAGMSAGPTASVRYLAASALVILAYGGAFALLGLLVRWPTWIGLAFLLFWEQPVSLVPGFLGKLTLLTHGRTIAGLPVTQTPFSELFEPPNTFGSTGVLLVVAAVTFALGGRLVSRREQRLAKG